MKGRFFSILLCALSSNAFAGEVDVLAVDVSKQADNRYHFDVTLKHADSGWDHYADRWEILDSDGNILATRTLYHPHVDEQPFSRSLTATLPQGINKVTVRGHDKVHQYGGATKQVTLP